MVNATIRLFLLMSLICAAQVIQCFKDYEFWSMNHTNTPIVIWHGMGDTCCDGIKRLKLVIQEVIPNVYIHSLMFGATKHEDFVNGFLADVNDKVKMACDLIKNDTRLANGYNAIGFSQGAQFLRAVAQRCPKPHMNNLISIGGQHQGVYGLPHCDSGFFCFLLKRIINAFAYFHFIQTSIVQSSYWHNPNNEYAYKNYNLFLADINQEKTFKEEYKKNLMSLGAFVLVKFLRDEMVNPIESQWFGFYSSNDANETIQTLEESDLYIQDKLGLKVLANSGRLHKLELDSRHLQFKMEWFKKQIILPFLKDKPVKLLYM